MTRQKWYNGLRFQIIFLLTLALLPIGAVAVYQTNRVEEQADQSTRLALLALTARAARSEEKTLERAIGVAEFFSSIAEVFIDNPARCADELPSFIEANPLYSFVGFLPKSGIAACSSSDKVIDFSSWPNFAETFAKQERTLDVNPKAPASGTSVFIVSEPFTVGGEFAGFVSLSIPHTALPTAVDSFEDMGLVELLTFNERGEVLTARNSAPSEVTELPQGRDLAQLTNSGRIAFAGTNMADEQRTYTVVPIGGSPARVMGVWRSNQSFASRLDAFIKPAIFPVLMWFASMAVALLSVYMLVLRHITRLQQNMDAFSKNRSIDKNSAKIVMPYELHALTGHFDSLTDDIMREEARLENTLREKNVLIKEVHHRVKNNLQLIASIMNMHIRTAKEAETKTVLSRVQDRVLSLATIHRDLYQSHEGGRVNTGDLVKEIVQKSLEMGIAVDTETEVNTDIDPVLLYPDQAVPLSLLVAEAMTNAMKHIGTKQSDAPYVSATLKQEGSHCTLTIVNSIGTYEAQDSTGLGEQLINAFAIQLGGRPVIEQTAQQYSFTLEFSVEEFEPETRDF